MDSIDSVNALAAAGYAAYRLTLIGHAPPIAVNYLRRVTNPIVGDLVLEITTAHRVAYVGWLIKKETEVRRYDEMNNREHYTETAYYVKSLTDGVENRWTNAEFIAIPTSIQQSVAWKNGTEEGPL